MRKITKVVTFALTDLRIYWYSRSTWEIQELSQAFLGLNSYASPVAEYMFSSVLNLTSHFVLQKPYIKRWFLHLVTIIRRYKGSSVLHKARFEPVSRGQQDILCFLIPFLPPCLRVEYESSLTSEQFCSVRRLFLKFILIPFKSLKSYMTANKSCQMITADNYGS